MTIFATAEDGQWYMAFQLEVFQKKWAKSAYQYIEDILVRKCPGQQITITEF